MYKRNIEKYCKRRIVMDGTELMSAIADGNYTPEIVGELTEKVE